MSVSTMLFLIASCYGVGLILKMVNNLMYPESCRRCRACGRRRRH
jgi:hypothetical protein